MNKNMRIGIIGAGASGLSAAFYLKKKGYNNINILEKEKTPGGKCSSVEYEGKEYEMGAVIGSNNYITVKEIMDEYNIQKGEAPENGFYDFKTEGINLLIKEEEKIELFWQQYFKYRFLLNTKYRRILKPGLDRLPKELNETMTEWAYRNNTELLMKSFTPLTPAYGYGYFEDTPAAYYIKYIKWPEYLNVFRKSKKFTWKSGVQNLWLEVAKDFHIEYECLIEKVEREEEIKVCTADKEMYFDKVIIACPLDDIVKVFNSAEVEKDLFNRINYIDYRVYLCVARELPRNIGYMLPNINRDKKGEPMVWYGRYNNRDVYNFYVIGDADINDQDIITNIKNAVSKIGGRLEKVIHKKRWRYFPHFLKRDLNAGIYDIIEGLQGRKNTFYIGEIMNFSSVEYTSRYAKHIVYKYF